MASGDGMNYAPRAKSDTVVEKGEFRFAAIGLDHGHITGMCLGLSDAGAECAMVYDPDPAKVEAFRRVFPEAQAARSEAEVLDDSTVRLIATAAVPSERGPLGLRTMDHGKHFFTDKAPFTTQSQLAAARAKVAETGLKWGVCYSERLQSEAGVLAGYLIEDGKIGRVLQVIGLGPHRLQPEKRPEWFFKKATYGGILTDIGSHQIEQFLYYTGAADATVTHARVANLNHPDYPELEDFGEANLVADNGASNYYRVDWFNPDGLSTWGDGRAFILGTDGYIELRKYVDLARSATSDHLYYTDHTGEHYIDAKGKTGFPYFGAFIRDCIDGTETAMTQAHAFKAAELCMKCQEVAEA